MSKNPSKTTNWFLVPAAAAALSGAGAYLADLYNVAPLAPILDAITSRLYMWIPELNLLASQAWFVISGILTGLAVFFTVRMLCLTFAGPTGGSRRMEKHLRKRDQHLHKEHWAGFNS